MNGWPREVEVGSITISVWAEVENEHHWEVLEEMFEFLAQDFTNKLREEGFKVE